MASKNGLNEKLKHLQKQKQLLSNEEYCLELESILSDVLAISEQQQNNKESSEIEVTDALESYKTLFNSLDEMQFILDSQANIITVNKAVCNKLGFEKNELVGKSMLSMHPENMRAETLETVKSMLQNKISSFNNSLIT
jgi:transcriptional regulator with PAS, ATPase and Fis domain